MKYSDEQRLEKIIVTTEKLLNYISDAGITREVVLAQEPVRWAITTPLYNIGEQAYNLSDAFKERYDHIPWAKISGLRHRLVHDCDNTNWSLICTIIFDILPDFLQDVSALRDAISRDRP